MHPTGMRSCYRPQTEVWGKVIFSEACVKNSVHRGGVHGGRGACMIVGGACMVVGGVLLLRACMVAGGACVVVGGVHGCGGCVVVGGMHGCGGHVLLWGVHVWLRGGMHGCGGHVWLSGVHGCRGVCMVVGGHGGHVWWWGACVGYDEIRSMSGRYASYWNAFLLLKYFR